MSKLEHQTGIVKSAIQKLQAEAEEKGLELIDIEIEGLGSNPAKEITVNATFAKEIKI